MLQLKETKVFKMIVKLMAKGGQTAVHLIAPPQKLQVQNTTFLKA